MEISICHHRDQYLLPYNEGRKEAKSDLHGGKFLSPWWQTKISKQWQITMHPNISVTKLKFTCHTVTVAVSNFQSECTNELLSFRCNMLSRIRIPLSAMLGRSKTIIIACTKVCDIKCNVHQSIMIPVLAPAGNNNFSWRPEGDFRWPKVTEGATKLCPRNQEPGTVSVSVCLRVCVSAAKRP